ncbi:hypothetical protein FRC03_012630 [Tulasnella sp. 419]|nr:hypothetical protein FRC03_012630 [Tulasnella sp. 419]
MQILRVMGILEHNEACSKASSVRPLPIPLHPQVYEVALQQLQNGADLRAVKAKNRQLIKQKFYKGIWDDPQFRNFCYLIVKTDSSHLYRALSRLNGIDVEKAPKINIHKWLNPKSPSYLLPVHQSVFYYSAPTSSKERFKACVASSQMEEMAWKYGHMSQILLDGTFGVCDRRVLLFIAMAIDEECKGVPLAFFLFSAPMGNKQTAVGYDTAILTEMLSEWKRWLEKRKAGKEFRPLAAITDTDTKEQAALLTVFLHIILFSSNSMFDNAGQISGSS